MMLNWSGVTVGDVYEAIRIFDENVDEYPPARNTFLEINGKRYPAKHIRALSYKVAYGIEAPKSEFSGGLETVRFFEKLGFAVKYTPHEKQFVEASKPHVEQPKNEKIVKNPKTQQARVPVPNRREEISLPKTVTISSKNVIEQKNALQLVLNRYFTGDIVSEKTFDWLTTPSDSNEYPYLVNALKEYRGMSGFDKQGYKLRCDFVCESRKLIFEYDERQHFTLARKAAFESYPADVPLYFDKHKWIDACESIRARDNNPPNRVETRAYYDSIRDIRSVQSGYRLIRIMHGVYDWENPEAEKYIEELLRYEPVLAKLEPRVFPSLKIGLYLQGENDFTKHIFKKRMEKVAKENLDLFVFPETCYTPYTSNFYGISLSEQDEMNRAIKRAMEISRQIRCAVIIGAEDKEGLIYSLYANAFCTDNETNQSIYIKQTMTSNSLLACSDYEDVIDDIFNPIVLKGLKIGMTICYDCNHAAFSRAWGKRDVDIIINSTGGNVVYQKWYRYNMARSIENYCFSFCTMGYTSRSQAESYTFGFTPNGSLLMGKPLFPIEANEDQYHNIYVYDTADFDGRYQPEITLNQNMTPNTKGNLWQLNPMLSDIASLLEESRKIVDGLYCHVVGDNNVIFCCVEGDDIIKPESVLCLLYHPMLKGISNKRYLIINRWSYNDNERYNNLLSVILKVRATENFCAVIYSSPDKSMCFQAGKNKNVQSVMQTDNNYRLDLGRMSGPEAIWKNKDGMQASWRKGYEALINTLV